MSFLLLIEAESFATLMTAEGQGHIVHPFMLIVVPFVFGGILAFWALNQRSLMAPFMGITISWSDKPPFTV